VPRWGLWLVRANRFVGTRLFMDRDGLPTAELVAGESWGKKVTFRMQTNKYG